MKYEFGKTYVWASPEGGYKHLEGTECRVLACLGRFRADNGDTSLLYVTDTLDADGNHYTASKEDLRLKDGQVTA